MECIKTISVGHLTNCGQGTEIPTNRIDKAHALTQALTYTSVCGGNFSVLDHKN